MLPRQNHTGKALAKDNVLHYYLLWKRFTNVELATT
jgi:hypothetical protein